MFYIQFSFMLNKCDYILLRQKFKAFLPLLRNPFPDRIATGMWGRGGKAAI